MPRRSDSRSAAGPTSAHRAGTAPAPGSRRPRTAGPPRPSPPGCVSRPTPEDAHPAPGRRSRRPPGRRLRCAHRVPARAHRTLPPYGHLLGERQGKAARAGRGRQAGVLDRGVRGRRRQRGQRAAQLAGQPHGPRAGEHRGGELRRSSGSSRQRSTVSAASAVTAPACPWWKRALRVARPHPRGQQLVAGRERHGQDGPGNRSGRTPSSRASSAVSRSAQPRASLNAQATPRRK